MHNLADERCFVRTKYARITRVWDKVGLLLLILISVKKYVGRLFCSFSGKKKMKVTTEIRDFSQL